MWLILLRPLSFLSLDMGPPIPRLIALRRDLGHPVDFPIASFPSPPQTYIAGYWRRGVFGLVGRLSLITLFKELSSFLVLRLMTNSIAGHESRWCDSDRSSYFLHTQQYIISLLSFSPQQLPWHTPRAPSFSHLTTLSSITVDRPPHIRRNCLRRLHRG